MSRFIAVHTVEGEKVIFDKRHSLWDIWKNFIIGAGSLVALIFLLTKFKPGPNKDVLGYVILISLLAAFFFIVYGIVPVFKRRFIADVYEGKDFIFPVLLMMVVVGAWIALFVYRYNEGFADIWTALVWVAFFVIVIGWLVYPILRWYFQHFMLTDRRLILHEGILTKKSIDLPLDQVNDIRFRQNLFERVFRYGDIVIESAGEYGQQPFTNIGNPEEIKKTILQQIHVSEEDLERRRSREFASEIARSMHEGASPADQRQVPPSPSGRADDLEVVEGLKQLAELRQSGALTEEEFQRAKKELLEKMGED